MSGRRKFATVDEYMESVSPEAAAVVNRIRKLVRSSVPAAREVISYNIPAFSLDKVFMYCAGFKAHVSVFPPLRKVPALEKPLARYRNAKGNLLFALDETVPYPLIARVAKALAAQRMAAAEKRPSRRKGGLDARVRDLCLAYPQTSEKDSWGHPNFRAGKKTFVTLEKQQGRPSIAFRLPAEQVQELARSPEFFITPYGRGLWVSCHADGQVAWRKIRELIDDSYRLVATPAMLKGLEGGSAP